MRLDFGEDIHLPYATINRYWTTLLGRSIGLGVLFIDLCQFPETAVMAQRLDHILRCKSGDTALVQTHYVVSTVQLLGLSPRYRFLPIAIRQVIQCASLYAGPASATVALFRQMVFCLLIGGCSALTGMPHLRIGADDICLATYDHLFCTVAYANGWSAGKFLPDA